MHFCTDFRFLVIWFYRVFFCHRPRGKADDDSDFDDYSEDDEEAFSNTFVVIGKVGCGTTTAVYACAHELGFKVLID